MNPESQAKEQCILDAMPGTAKEIERKCRLPQATVSKLIAKLILRNKAFHAGWIKPEGVQASMVFQRGPAPAGYVPPERPTKAPSKPASTRKTWQPAPVAPKPINADVAAWDAECDTSHLFSHDKRVTPIPQHIGLFAMYGEQFVTASITKPLDNGWRGANIEPSTKGDDDGTSNMG